MANCWRHDDFSKRKHFPRNWPYVKTIRRSPVNSPHKGQWRGALMFSLMWTLNKRLSKQSWGWWFETPSCSLWRHYNWRDGLWWPAFFGHCMCFCFCIYLPHYDVSVHRLSFRTRELTFFHWPPVLWLTFKFISLNDTWFVSLEWWRGIFY